MALQQIIQAQSKCQGCHLAAFGILESLYTLIREEFIIVIEQNNIRVLKFNSIKVIKWRQGEGEANQEVVVNMLNFPF